MKRIAQYLLGMALLLSAASGFGQTALSSTTLSSAVSDSKTQVVVVASASGITAGSTALYVDREEMFVTAVNSTTLTVIRGYNGTRANSHASSATVYVGPNSGFGAFNGFSKSGSCTAGNELYLPQINVSIGSGAPTSGFISDCFGSAWQYDFNLPLYKLTLAPNAQRSATSPTAGANSSFVAQAGGASTSASNAGAAGGTMTVSSGAGGAGASTGTAGAGGALTLSAGAGAAASGTAAVGGNGGAVAITAGASGGSVTSGNGGAVNITAGASANGSTAAGNGGDVALRAGAVGTGGTGAAGLIKFKDAADGTKVAAFSLTGITTATTRTITVPDASITLGSAVEKACGTTVTCAATTTNNVIVAYGSAALSSASPSTASITALPFTSSSTYWCTATPEGTTAAVAAGGIAINKTSGTAMTLTGPNTVTTVVDFVCHGT